VGRCGDEVPARHFLFGKDGCGTATARANRHQRVVRVRLIEAENDKYRVDGVTGRRVDFAKQAAAQRKRQAGEAAARRTALLQKCNVVYRATIHKKVADLTVEESKQIKACELLDMYLAR
jgi:hypothetical protein